MAEIQLKNSDLRFYKYKIDSFYILIPGQKDHISLLPDQVLTMSIEKNYKDDYFPIFRVVLSLNPKTYHTILKNKLNVKFKMRLQKFINSDGELPAYSNDVINDVFCIYMDEDTPFISEKAYDDAKDISGELTPSILQDFRKEYTFFLFKEDDIQNTKNIMNTIIKSSNMTNMLAYILSKNNFKKVLLAPLDNKLLYDNIILQPITVLGNIEYLEQQYGFYNQGALIFFDFDRTYIIPQDIGCHVWERSEYKQTAFLIKESTNVQGAAPGCFDNKSAKTFFINITSNNYNASNETVVADHIDGNNLLIINPITAEVDKVQSDAIQRGSGTYKILINKYNNKMMNSSEKSKINESSKIVTVNCSDFDISAITPNKEFRFLFENKNLNKEFGGSYRMCNQLIHFVKRGPDFQIAATCELRRPV